jgi:hypothetical protein
LPSTVLKIELRGLGGLSGSEQREDLKDREESPPFSRAMGAPGRMGNCSGKSGFQDSGGIHQRRNHHRVRLNI